MRAAGAHAHLAGAHAKLGSAASAHQECDKAKKILSASVDDAANTMVRRLRAIAYGDLAEAHATLAAGNSTGYDSAAEDWRSARDMYRHSLALLEDLKKRGILDAEELPELDKFRQKIADCDARLAK